MQYKIYETQLRRCNPLQMLHLGLERRRASKAVRYGINKVNLGLIELIFNFINHISLKRLIIH